MKEIRENLEKDNLLFGRDETLKGLKNKTLDKVFISKNVDEETRNSLAYYANLQEIDVVNTNLTSIDLGTLCKKPFSVSMLGLKS